MLLFSICLRNFVKIWGNFGNFLGQSKELENLIVRALFHSMTIDLGTRFV